MKVFRGLPNDAARAPCALTIGNFDGVHRGHQALLARVRAASQALGLEAAVMTFEPHTRAVVRPDAPLHLLTQLPEKLAQFARLGIDEAAETARYLVVDQPRDVFRI